MLSDGRSLSSPAAVVARKQRRPSGDVAAVGVDAIAVAIIAVVAAAVIRLVPAPSGSGNCCSARRHGGAARHWMTIDTATVIAATIGAGTAHDIAAANRSPYIGVPELAPSTSSARMQRIVFM